MEFGHPASRPAGSLSKRDRAKSRCRRTAIYRRASHEDRSRPLTQSFGAESVPGHPRPSRALPRRHAMRLRRTLDRQACSSDPAATERHEQGWGHLLCGVTSKTSARDARACDSGKFVGRPSPQGRDDAGQCRRDRLASRFSQALRETTGREHSVPPALPVGREPAEGLGSHNRGPG